MTDDRTPVDTAWSSFYHGERLVENTARCVHETSEEHSRHYVFRNGWEAAIRAEAGTYDSLSEHRRQSDAGTHLFDDACYFCRAESAGTLDVERLARALHKMVEPAWGGPGAEHTHLWCEDQARDIAAEYARLAEADRPKPTFNPFELDAIPDD